MILPVQVQLLYFMSTIIAGIVVGVLFDVYRIIRGFNNPKRILTAISDLLFWILAAIIVFVFLLYTNNGDLRYYTFIGLLLGLFLYFKLVSKRFIIVLRTLVYFVIKFFRIMFMLLMYPIRIIRYTLRYMFFVVRRFIRYVNIKHSSFKKKKMEKKKNASTNVKQKKLKKEKKKNTEKKKAG